MKKSSRKTDFLFSQRKSSIHFSSKLLLCLMFFAIVNAGTSAFSQQTVQGVVTDAQSGESLPGVNITLVGTMMGTVTDIDGRYSLSVAPDAELEFSYIGYLTTRVPVDGRQQINVQMNIDLAELDEVVVVGYGVQRRSDITGSVGMARGRMYWRYPPLMHCRDSVAVYRV
jgi:TonB-dependent starch-binding outer membrane protein SusC